MPLFYPHQLAFIAKLGVLTKQFLLHYVKCPQLSRLLSSWLSFYSLLYGHGKAEGGSIDEPGEDTLEDGVQVGHPRLRPAASETLNNALQLFSLSPLQWRKEHDLRLVWSDHINCTRLYTTVHKWKQV